MCTNALDECVPWRACTQKAQTSKLVGLVLEIIVEQIEGEGLPERSVG